MWHENNLGIINEGMAKNSIIGESGMAAKAKGISVRRRGKAAKAIW